MQKNMITAADTVTGSLTVGDAPWGSMPGRVGLIRRYLAAFPVLVCLLAALPEQTLAGSNERFPGFGLSLSRVVVSADDRSSGQVYAVNNSDNVYLVQSRVWPADGVTGYAMADKTGAARAAVPFMVTPPLKRIERHGVLPLRIITLPQAASLPGDRESLFFLSSKAIPSKSGDEKAKARDVGEGGGARLSLALQSYIKLFWRPSGLGAHAIFDGGVADKLTFRRTGDRLTVTNPTPYHITFGLLNVAGKPVDPESRRAMVPPMGSHDYPLPPGAGAGEVTWQVIDEFGLMTDLKRQPLS
ncbi:fimbrial biogenesis chaperone [Enterobacter ludwigii]